MRFPRKIPADQVPSTVGLQLPKIITFDAYNTLYSTTLPVMEQYCLAGKKYGIDAKPEELTQRFPSVFKNLRIQHPNYGKNTGITANEWWTLLIQNVFKPHQVPPEMIEHILTVFEGFGAYSIYPDLLDLLRSIRKKSPDTVLGVISNTDPIMYKLLKNIGLNVYFDNNIYLSYDIDLSKPDVRLFDHVLKDIVKKRPNLLEAMTLQELRGHCWHIGDEKMNDMIGPCNAGWVGILLDRANKYHYFNEEFQHIERSEHDLYQDKIDNNYQVSYETSLKNTDVVQLAERQLVISNLKPIKSLLDRGNI
ncbi:LAMI_0G16204g1_1 [Lachancea mirantina]|uniref:LAMI_0G16204g1_1 n=1 Tax=Lachancea mirantina TaxID=1230905 RepID=A0A1G4KCK3_9SACH|nr:LAMI_0G16204g1_1 [Lachancea mirantina]